MQSFDVYPNPFHNVLHVQLKEGQNVDRIVITNILGQRVKTVLEFDGDVISINTGDLDSGLYFINYYQGNKLQGVNKMMKQK